MKKSINVNSLKGVNFFLGGIEKVDSLEIGAQKNGGATLFKDGIFSNYDNGENNITIDSKNNTISIIIPSTIDVDKEIDNKKYVEYYSSIIKNYTKFKNVFFYNSIGSWYSDDLNKVVIEKNTIITIEVNDLTIKDIMFMINLGKIVKKDMSQEAISVIVNNALCLV